MSKRCRGINKRGERCRSPIVNDDGLCPSHSGAVNMREIGRKGGQASIYDPLVDDALGATADAKVRKLARQKLNELIDDENTQIALRACIAVAAFSPERPVSDVDAMGWKPEYAGLPTKQLEGILKAAYEAEHEEPDAA